jgi:hypothetical protein
MRDRRISRLLPPEVEEYRDVHWHRENTACVETAVQAEEFIERVGFSYRLRQTDFAADCWFPH